MWESREVFNDQCKKLLQMMLNKSTNGIARVALILKALLSLAALSANVAFEY